MAATFWWDRYSLGNKKAANGDPNLAIKGLAGKLDGEDKPRNHASSICGFLTRPFRGVVVPNGHCLFMSGTTSELAEALNDDNQQGVEGFVCFVDDLDVRFIRKLEGRLSIHPKTVSIVGIGCLNSYWAQTPVALPEVKPGTSKIWSRLEYNMLPTGGGLNLDAEKGYFAATSINTLRVLLRGDCRGVSAWF